MGPFPHDGPPATISSANPAGTDGFEFVEFAHPEPQKLADLFQRMGYTPVARPRASCRSMGPVRPPWRGASCMRGMPSSMR
jgi:4-hydroxyphenylpyruvate dioxygenase-like putative hemolysin